MSKSVKPILKELRFFFCPTCPDSTGIRSFLNNNFSNLHNSPIQFIVRESDQADASVIARYSKIIYHLFIL